MWKDPIVEEVRRIREEHAAKFDYDIAAICRDLRKQQTESGREVVTLEPRRPPVVAPQEDTSDSAL